MLVLGILHPVWDVGQKGFWRGCWVWLECVGPVQVGDSYTSGLGLGRARLDWGKRMGWLGKSGNCMGKGVQRRVRHIGGFPTAAAGRDEGGAFLSHVLYTHIWISLDIFNCDFNVNIEIDCQPK